MKTCKFCAEEIQEEAKKCKHCGEWLDNESNPSAFATAKGLFKKSSAFLKDTVDKTNEWRTRHLFAPTDDKPMEISNVTFYSKHMVYYGKRYEYADIRSIKFHASVTNTNGINTDTETDLRIQFPEKTLDLSRSSFFGIGSGSKTRQQMDFIQLFLKKLTVDIRLSRFLEEVKTKGYFSYGSQYKIHNNGDVEINGEVEDNICKANEEKRLDYGGDAFTSLFGTTKFSDPYCIYIWESANSSRNFLFSSRIEIYVYYDKDIIDMLIFKLAKDKYIMREQTPE